MAQPRASGQRKEKVISVKLFVCNLSFNTTKEEIEALFAQAGQVEEVFLPTDRATGRMRGFAFVTMDSAEAASTAIERFNDHELGGRQLRVNEATERPPRSPSFDSSPFGGNRPGGAGKPSRPKGSRRNVRARKRSL